MEASDDLDIWELAKSDVVPQTEDASAALIMARDALSLVQRIIDEAG